MSKVIPMKHTPVKPQSSGEFLQQIFLDAKEQEEMDPLKKREILSKNLKSGQTLELRRETVLTSLDVLSKLVNDITKWKSLFDKAAIETKPMMDAFDSANEIIYTYLSSFDKKIRKPVKGQGQIAQQNYYLKKFREYETNRDDFVNLVYQPFIFLKQYASILTDASLYIAVQARSRQTFVKKSASYFPRCERLSVVDQQAKAEKKMRWVEAQQNKVSIEQAQAEEAND